MRKKRYFRTIVIITIIILNISKTHLLSQNVSNFRLIGSTNSFNSQLLWLTNAALNPNYQTSYNLHLSDEVSTILNKSFEFNGTVKFPIPVQIGWLYEKENRAVFSDVFLLEPGAFRIRIDSISEKPVFTLLDTSDANREMFKIQKLIGGILNDSNSSINTLQEYIKQNPSSYPAFCLLSVIYYRKGFNPVMNNILLQFTDSLRNIPPFKMLEEQINDENFLVSGQLFPFDKVSFGSKLKNIANGSRYTLIEFWATWCGPCLKQIPEWRRIQKETSRKNLSIIGVALERSNEPKYLNKFLNKEKIYWINLLDIKGAESNKLLIREIPNNILIDINGKIIQRNITPKEMEIFLQTHLSY